MFSLQHIRVLSLKLGNRVYSTSTYTPHTCVIFLVEGGRGEKLKSGIEIRNGDPPYEYLHSFWLPSTPPVLDR